MDQLMDIYVNVEGPPGNHSKWTREIKSTESIYDKIDTLEPNSTGPALSGAGDVNKSSCRAAAVFLGLLCLLLLTGLITLVFLYTKRYSEWKMEKILFHNSYNNLTKELDHLQTSYNSLSKERDHLQTSSNNLAEERDQFKKGMVFHEEDSEVSMAYENFHARNVALQSCSGEDSKLTAAVPGIKLYRLVVVSFGLLCILQATLNISLRLALDTEASCKNLTEERDDLKRKLNNFDQLQTSYNNIISERHQLENNLTRQKDQYQTCYNELATEKNQLRRRVKNLTKERSDLQRKLRDQNDQQEWVYFSSSSYYISSIMKSWQESRDDCLQRGADLIIIDSEEEQEFTKRFQRLVWIGLTDRETEGTWKWVDGTPLTTRYWAPSEPNGAPRRDEDCAEIKAFNLKNSWNDELCYVQKFWICEKTSASKS
ncbi:CD209 antigen-like [Enoplosus armatus]|uniref:CD209 antigen-like n=1 Tax=Enoplosus armatus TaxID=215367 RepID=UPI00399665BE